MRSKVWRRYHLERVYKKRLKRFRGWWYRFYTSNGDYIACPFWIDFIGRSDFFFLKTLTTTKSDTKSKSKYSPNRSKRRYSIKPKTQTYGAREKDKELVMKIINEYYNGY